MSTPQRLRQTLTFAGFAALGLVSWLQTSAMSRWIGDRLACNARELAQPIGQLARLGAVPRKGAVRTAPQPAPRGLPRGSAPSVAPLLADPYRAADCLQLARLSIIAAGDDAAGSMAVLSIPTQSGSKWELLREGDTRGEFRVWHIGADRVWLQGKDQACQLRMFDGPAPAPIPGNSNETRANALSALIAASIERLGPTECRVDRALVDRVLQDPARFLKVRVAPDAQAGAVRGLKLLGIRPDSLLAAIGLRDGDRLDAINGMGLGDAESMMLALARLRQEPHLAVRIQREGKEVQLDIHLV